MQITRQADYAVRAVLHLARLGPEGQASTANIAQEQHIPSTFLAKIVSQLAGAGLLVARRGARGGVRLARPAEAISLLQVVEAIDGPVLLNECLADPQNCPLSPACPVCAVWNDAQFGLVQKLSQTNFGQLAAFAAPTIHYQTLDDSQKSTQPLQAERLATASF
jgi:Rrf2 family protein